MHIKLLSNLVELILSLFKHTSPVVVEAAEGAAVETAEQDPKVQAVTEASVALVAAAQTLKTAIAQNQDVAAAPATEEKPAS